MNRSERLLEELRSYHDQRRIFYLILFHLFPDPPDDNLPTARQRQYLQDHNLGVYAENVVAYEMRYDDEGPIHQLYFRSRDQAMRALHDIFAEVFERIRTGIQPRPRSPWRNSLEWARGTDDRFEIYAEATYSMDTDTGQVNPSGFENFRSNVIHGRFLQRP